MNFGSVSWTFGSIVRTIPTGTRPRRFSQNGVGNCAQEAQKKSASARAAKRFAKCNDKINKGKPCDTVSATRRSPTRRTDGPRHRHRSHRRSGRERRLVRHHQGESETYLLSQLNAPTRTRWRRSGP
jgi:hypothetical protein